jgi:hypothetical protein
MKGVVKKSKVKCAVKKTKPFNPQYHLPKYCQDMQYSCAWCYHVYNSLERLEEHIVVEHPYNCNHCLKEIKSWKAFLVHAEVCNFASSNAVDFVENEEKP